FDFLIFERKKKDRLATVSPFRLATLVVATQKSDRCQKPLLCLQKTLSSVGWVRISEWTNFS
ncbi:MAG: hypothetical protein WCF50_03210, partial [Pseudolabrys sp.]